MHIPALAHRLGAEALGAFWLVFGGFGSAIFAAHFMQTADPANRGIGFVGVSLAFGLTVLTMAYAVGHVSGGHFNPAVTIGCAVAKRFAWKDATAYVITQVVAGLVAGVLLHVIATGREGFTAAGNFATNGFGAASPGGYGLMAAFVAEALLTAFFLFIILGSTDGRAPVGFAPISIGLGLTLIHLISIPITNTSVNPARSTAVAFCNGGDAPAQLWLFWVAPGSPRSSVRRSRALPTRSSPAKSAPASTSRARPARSRPRSARTEASRWYRRFGTPRREALPGLQA